MKKLTLCFLLLSLIYQTNAQNDLKVYYTVDSLKVLLSNGLNFSTELIYNGSSYYRLHYKQLNGMARIKTVLWMEKEP
jgi:hypothetical protein